MASMMGKRVRYRFHKGAPDSYEVEGVITQEIPATLINVETFEEQPAVRFVIQCDDGEVITTTAMASVERQV